jgi:hypothetical protein
MLDVVALKTRGVEALERDEAAMRGMLAARDAGPAVAVTQKKRVRRARVNTIAPSDYNGGFRVLYHAIDTYAVNVHGKVRSDFMELLPSAQDEAKEAGENVLGPFPPFLGVNLSIKPYGGGTFRFLLENDDLAVKVRKEGHAPTMATAQVRVSSACLHRLGYVAALRSLGEWLAVWCPGGRLQVSEIDLCVDTQGWQPRMEDFSGSRESWPFVCPVDRPHLIPYDGYAGYVRFGTGGRDGSRSGAAPIQCSIYDKTEEVRVHDKGWFIPLWAQSASYIEGELVTRVEFRFRREWLKERGIETQAQVLASLDAIWAEGLEWCRYTVPAGPGEDSNRSRLRTRDEWRVLRSVEWSGGRGGILDRIDQARPKLERTLAAIGGHFVTLQAMLINVLDVNLPELMEIASPAILKRWEARGEDYRVKVDGRVLRLGGLALG